MSSLERACRCLAPARRWAPAALWDPTLVPRLIRWNPGSVGNALHLTAHRVGAVNVGFPGLGTVINVATVVIGALLGMWVGHRIPERTRSVVTDCLG